MKPDWKDAPEWAQWLSQDPDGDWYWWEDKPERHWADLDFRGSGQSQFAGKSDDVSLERRP